jgi:hypothetical protein
MSLKKYLKKSKRLKDYGFDNMIIGPPTKPKYEGGFSGHLPKYFNPADMKKYDIKRRFLALKSQSKKSKSKYDKYRKKYDYSVLFGGKVRKSTRVYSKTRKVRKSRKIRKHRK